MTNENFTREALERAFDTAERYSFPAGSDERIGCIFGAFIIELFGAEEGFVIWERIAGANLETLLANVNDLHRQKFKNAFGISLEAASEKLSKLRKPKLQVVN